MRLVVIGGMAAGLSAASRARRVDKSLEILVLEKGDLVSVGACGLPYYVEGRVGSPAELVTYDAEYLRRERNIMVRTGAEVEGIRHASRQVVLAGGERVHYDKLVIATGGRPNPAAITDESSGNVFALLTVAEASRLREFLDTRQPRRAVIAGAGYIGLEMADVLRARGLAVTVCDSSRFVLGRADAELTESVRRRLEQAGIELRLSATATDFTSVRSDLTVVAAGIAPNVRLAADAGVRLGRTGAIATSDRMETSINGIFAAGDCAEATHIVTGRPVYIPLGTTANRMGRIAGACAAGARERFTGVAGTSISKVAGLGIAVTGLCLADAKKEGFDPVSARIEALDRPAYFNGRATTVELVADRRTRRLLGGYVTGEEGVAGRINVIAAAITAGLRAEAFEQLDLAYTPPLAAASDPLLVAAHQLLKLLD